MKHHRIIQCMPAHRPAETDGASLAQARRVERMKNTSTTTRSTDTCALLALPLLISPSSLFSFFLSRTSARQSTFSPMLITSSSSAPSRSRPRSSSNPRAGDTQDQLSTATQLKREMAAVADFTKEHPSAKDFICAFLKTGLSVAVALERTKAILLPAPQKDPPRPQSSTDLAPAPADTHATHSYHRSGLPLSGAALAQEPPCPATSSASLSRKRLASEAHEQSVSNKRTRSGARDLTALTDANFTGSNDAQFDQLWLPARICNMVKEGKFVQLWYFSPAGLQHAATNKKKGVEEAMTL
ncbi:hypothetical protein V8E36_002019 [Tilletia maclaganii]